MHLMTCVKRFALNELEVERLMVKLYPYDRRRRCLIVRIHQQGLPLFASAWGPIYIQDFRRNRAYGAICPQP